MNGSDGNGDKPGGFSPDDWQPSAGGPQGGAPDAPDYAPGSFSFSDPVSSTPITPHGPRITVPAAAQLLLGIPWVIWSLGVVSSLSAMFFDGFATVIPVVIWILSGLVIFWPRTEDYLARYLFRLRRPTMLEQQKLDVAWRAVCSQVHVDPQYYKLWIEESDDINGYAMAGKSIAVTRWALNSLPPRQLQAVLAHELGHHQGGNTWTALVVFWYALPGRSVAGLVRAISGTNPVVGCLVAAFLFLSAVGLALDSWIFHRSWGWGFYAVLPFLVPIPLAWFTRKSELMADQVAADLGYARDTVAFLYDLQAQGEDVARRAAGWRGAVYSRHPSVADRITALERYLQNSRS
jgi:Zn-dependent protease with chaperone function